MAWRFYKHQEAHTANYEVVAVITMAAVVAVVIMAQYNNNHIPAHPEQVGKLRLELLKP